MSQTLKRMQIAHLCFIFCPASIYLLSVSYPSSICLLLQLSDFAYFTLCSSLLMNYGICSYAWSTADNTFRRSYLINGYCFASLSSECLRYPAENGSRKARNQELALATSGNWRGGPSLHSLIFTSFYSSSTPRVQYPRAEKDWQYTACLATLKRHISHCRLI